MATKFFMKALRRIDFDNGKLVINEGEYFDARDAATMRYLNGTSATTEGVDVDEAKAAVAAREGAVSDSIPTVFTPTIGGGSTVTTTPAEPGTPQNGNDQSQAEGSTNPSA